MPHCSLWIALLPASSVSALFWDALHCQLLKSCSLIAYEQNAHLASLLFIGLGVFSPDQDTFSTRWLDSELWRCCNICTRVLKQFFHVNLVAVRSNPRRDWLQMSQCTARRWMQCNGCINNHSIRALCPDTCLQQLHGLLALHTSTHGYVALV